jgi:HipA-like protein
MIKVWTHAVESGLLDRHGERGSTFAYLPDTPAERSVSVTMPVRLASWSVPFGLLPIFEMNLPEGFLRERLRLAFAKATGTFDEFDLLSVVGRSQVGRIRYTGDKEQLNEEVPFQSATSSATCWKSSRLSPASAGCSPRSSCATKRPSPRWSIPATASRPAIGVQRIL